MAKLGRPKLQPGERKSAVTFMRVTPGEWKDINAAAKTQGMKRHEWMRAVLIPAAEQARRK
jgi:hypothetical protein